MCLYLGRLAKPYVNIESRHCKHPFGLTLVRHAQTSPLTKRSLYNAVLCFSVIYKSGFIGAIRVALTRKPQYHRLRAHTMLDISSATTQTSNHTRQHLPQEGSRKNGSISGNGQIPTIQRWGALPSSVAFFSVRRPALKRGLWAIGLVCKEDSWYIGVDRVLPLLRQ